VNETVLTVVGYVAQDPKLRVTSTGTRVVSFRLASTERRYDRSLGGWRDGDTIFYTVTCWRNAGENVLESLRTGDPVLVHGRLRDASYEKEGHKHAVFEIHAYALGHDVSRGVSRFTKASLAPGQREVVLDDEPADEMAAAAGAVDGLDDEAVSPSAA
jgi:single-strand DNA-binding protein